MAFNFQSFLAKMRDASAFGIVTDIRTFIAENSSKRLTPDEFVTVIRHFLEETGGKLASHQLWRDATEAELDNAHEGLEKYLMNKMYKACFQPQTSDDVDRDQALADRLQLMAFVKPEHLDIPVEVCQDKAVKMAEKELCKMDTYKAPRDKMVCVLNCCKIINSVLAQHTDKAGADEFFPLLVYVTLSSKPPNLYSNMRFIQRFRNPDKLTGEPGYYFTTLQGAIEFAQTLNADRLSIDEAEFEEELNKALDRMNASAASSGGSVQVGADLIDMDATAPAQSVSKSSVVATKAPTVGAVKAAGMSVEVRNPSYGNLLDLGGGGEDFGMLDKKVEPASSAQTAMSIPPAYDLLGEPVSVGGPAVNAEVKLSPAMPEKPIGKVAGDPTLKELMAALHEPAVEKFMTASVEDLTMIDIPLLLADYKRVVKLTRKVGAFMDAQGLGALS